MPDQQVVVVAVLIIFCSGDELKIVFIYKFSRPIHVQRNLIEFSIDPHQHIQL